MEEIKKLLKVKKNLIGLIVVLVLLVALPVGIYLSQRTQIFKPRAAGPQGQINFPEGSASYYTNLCGSGTAANQNPQDVSGCEHCNSDNGSCTGDDTDYIYMFACTGLYSDCDSFQNLISSRSGSALGTNPTAAFVPGTANPNTTYQIDVFDTNCIDGNNFWNCGTQNSPIGLKSYMVWYSGSGATPTSTPAPTQTLSVTATLLTGPAACTGIRSNIYVNWDNINGALSYLVYNIEEDSIPPQLIVSQFPSDYTFSVSNSGSHAFRVKAYSGVNAAGTLLADSGVSNIVNVPVNYCGGISPTPIGGIFPTLVPTIPGGYLTPSTGGGPCTINPVCDTCTAPLGQCGNSGRKQCTYTGPAGCTPATAPPQVCDAGNTCTAPQICQNGTCITDGGGGTQPTSSPVPTTPVTGPVTYRIANAPGSSASNCNSALNAALPQAWPAGGTSVPLNNWNILTGSFNSPGEDKYICAQFYNASNQSILSSPTFARVRLISTVSPTPTPTTGPGVPTPTPTPTTTQPTVTTRPVSPTVTTTPGRTTAGYRIAESLTELSGTVYKNYDTHPTLITHIFSNSNPGAKQICVQFKASDGTESTPTCSSIELVRQPVITSCNLDFSSSSDGSSVLFKITGIGFGATSTGATVNSGNTNLGLGQWSDQNVEAKLLNPPSGVSFPITLTTSQGLIAQGACSSISQLAIGAQLFCPQVKDVTIPDTEVTIIEAIPSGRVFTEKVSLKVLRANNVGVIEGLRTRLQEGRAYKLAIKVPRGVRRVLNNLRGGFVALPGTTNVDFTRDGNGAKLPLGDIFPVSIGDGAINSADFTQLKRDISAAKATNNSYSDLNLDNWVNSFEWACMRPEIGTSDEEVPGAGPLN